MTKILLASDLHHEFYEGTKDPLLYSLPSENVDVLVIAGDLATGSLIEECLKIYCDRFKNVIYVAGNHCFWQSSIDDRIEQFTKLDAQISNLHFLENRVIELEGQKFAGCTLWFNEDPVYTRSTWIDFRYVEGGSHSIFTQNRKNVEFLEKNVDDQTIVISHHLPSYSCVSDGWKGCSTNCYFVCDVEKIILDKKPKLWAHGHAHQRCDIMIADTRVVRNARAYPFESSGFDPNFLIDTSSSK